MKTHEVEEMLGINKQTLIYYEKEGLVKPVRDGNNYRNYHRDDLETLELIVLLRSMEVTIDEIKMILNDRLSIREVLETKKEFIKNSKIKLEDIDQKINDFIKRKEVKVSFDNESIINWIDRDTLFFNERELKYNDLVLSFDESECIKISMCSVLYNLDILRIFLNYYVDIDIWINKNVYSFQILNNKQVARMFDYFESKQIKVIDPYGLMTLYRTKDLVSLNKYLDLNFKKWAKRDHLDNPRDNNFLYDRLRKMK